MNTRRRGILKPVRADLIRAPRGKAAVIFLRLLPVLLCLLLINVGYNYFTVKEIQITGSERLTYSAVISAAGIRTGASIFTVRAEKVAARLLRLPGVRSAAVTRKFPDAVSIMLVERKPAAGILVDGGYWVVDREGVIFDWWPHLAESLPVITGIKGDNFSQGTSAGDFEEGDALTVILQALGNVPELEVAEFNLVDKHNLVCYTADGLPVLLGDKEMMEQKLSLLWHSLPYLAGAGRITHVDVQTGDRLVVINGE